jgi:hypothetical protein
MRWGCTPFLYVNLCLLQGLVNYLQAKKGGFLKSYAIETFTRCGEVRLPRLGWSAKSPG